MRPFDQLWNTGAQVITHHWHLLVISAVILQRKVLSLRFIFFFFLFCDTARKSSFSPFFYISFSFFAILQRKVPSLHFFFFFFLFCDTAKKSCLSPFFIFLFCKHRSVGNGQSYSIGVVIRTLLSDTEYL